LALTGQPQNRDRKQVLLNHPPAVTLQGGTVTGLPDAKRPSPITACVDDKVTLLASASDVDGDLLTYSWTSTDGQITVSGPQASLDTKGLAPGRYTVTVEVDDGFGCVAFDSVVVQVLICPDQRCFLCFGPTLTVIPSATKVKAGETIEFSTPGVVGGKDYGKVAYTWKASAGETTSDGAKLRLDTTGIAIGTTIEVWVTATSEFCLCSALGSARVKVE